MRGVFHHVKREYWPRPHSEVSMASAPLGPRSADQPKILLLLGAGASIEAGLPSAAEVTRRLASLASTPTPSRVNRLGRVVTVLREQAVRLSSLSPDVIDFEMVFGALVEAVERRDPISSGTTAALLAPHLDGAGAARVLRDLLLYLRGMFMPLGSVDYLSGLLACVRQHRGVVATLNYDLSVERWFVERNLPLNTGFVDRHWRGFPDNPGETELLKLHGSLNWLRSTLSMDERDSILSHLLFFSEPFRAALDKTARWSTGEPLEGVRPLMNIGIAKEQLYVTPPFSEIFRRFEKGLAEVDLVVIVGYSFRDYVINRLLLQALKARRRPVAVVDPYVNTLVSTRAIVDALKEYGVLVTCQKTAGVISEADVSGWLRISLPDPATGFQPRRARPEDDALRERLEDLCIELAVLEHQIQLALRHPVHAWEVINSIVRTVERCRGTYHQAAIAAGARGARRTIRVMDTRRDVESAAWRTEGENTLARAVALRIEVERILERPGLPESALALYGSGSVDNMFDDFLEGLRNIGVGISPSPVVPG